ncbi:unnamed protein product [Symbiodinium sp. KB8]|nr:unnamed protein product [Symbiodinium sp. KB8]
MSFLLQQEQVEGFWPDVFQVVEAPGAPRRIWSFDSARALFPEGAFIDIFFAFAAALLCFCFKIEQRPCSSLGASFASRLFDLCGEDGEPLEATSPARGGSPPKEVREESRVASQEKGYLAYKFKRVKMKGDQFRASQSTSDSGWTQAVPNGRLKISLLGPGLPRLHTEISSLLQGRALHWNSNGLHEANDLRQKHTNIEARRPEDELEALAVQELPFSLEHFQIGASIWIPQLPPEVDKYMQSLLEEADMEQEPLWLAAARELHQESVAEERECLH